MNRNARNLYRRLHAMGCPVFERADTGGRGQAAFAISAEEPDSWLWLDYYGEYRDGCVWVSPDLESRVEAAGYYVEWENPGCALVVEA